MGQSKREIEKVTPPSGPKRCIDPGIVEKAATLYKKPGYSI